MKSDVETIRTASSNHSGDFRKSTALFLRSVLGKQPSGSCYTLCDQPWWNPKGLQE